jgi:hypothetical protein
MLLAMSITATTQEQLLRLVALDRLQTSLAQQGPASAELWRKGLASIVTDQNPI